MSELKFKTFPFEVKATHPDRTFEGYISVFNNVDSYGEVVSPTAFDQDLADFKANGFIGGLNHDWDNPIGVPVDAYTDKNGLFVKARLSETQHGNDVYTLLKDRVVKKLSIGYRQLGQQRVETLDEAMAYWGQQDYSPSQQDLARAQGGFDLLTRMHPYEGSPVTVPANELALISGVKRVKRDYAGGVEERLHDLVELLDDLKAVSGNASLPLAERDLAWDAGEANAELRRWAGAEDAPNARYRQAFFWYDSDNPDKFGSYKLQFARPIGGGLKAVPRALFAVAAALQGARGGVNVPDADKAAIRAKVSRYYARMRQAFNDDSIVAPWDKPKAAYLTDLPTTEREFEDFLRDAGFARTAATVITLHGFKASQGEPEQLPDADVQGEPTDVTTVETVVDAEGQPDAAPPADQVEATSSGEVDEQGDPAAGSPSSDDAQVRDAGVTLPVELRHQAPNLTDPLRDDYVSPQVFDLRQQVFGQLYSKFLKEHNDAARR